MYVHLEGLPGAGKSTLLDWLTRRYTCSLIPDLANPKEINEKAFRLDYSYALAVECLKSALTNFSANSLVLQERGYLTVLAYHYAQDALYGEADWKNACELLASEVAARRVVIPDRILVLSMPSRLSLERQRDVKMPFWRDLDCITCVSDFYLHYAEKPMFGECVNVIDASVSVKEVCRNASQIIVGGLGTTDGR